MPTISLKAIQSTVNLTGAETKLREALAAYCSTYNPSTDRPLAQIGELVGMRRPQASLVMASLIKKGEVGFCELEKRYFLLKLDDYQLEKIAKNDVGLLHKLAELGCENARQIVSILETNVSKMETIETFLLLYFLFSMFPKWKQFFPKWKLDVSKMETNVSKMETPLKEYNDYVFLNDSLNCKEEEILKAEVEKPAAAADTVFTDGDIPEKLTEKNKDIQEKLNGDKPDEDWAKIHTRTDLQPVDDWISYVQNLAECRNLTVRAVWERYLKDSGKKKKSATRYRFLKNWLWPDIQACPEEIALEEKINEPELDERELRAHKRLGFNKAVDEYLRTKGVVQIDSPS